MLEAQACDITDEVEQDLFGGEYLIKRPLLQAIEPSEHGTAPVLLIDELDRADEEFEAFLLELLSDFQITIPEIGTIRAAEPPVVIITSNRTREIHDALKRRCIYQWIDVPSLRKEYNIVTLKVPLVYSPNEVLRHKDFGEMTWEEIQEAKRVIAKLEWQLGERQT
jgi:MoxR-like ATPase